MKIKTTVVCLPVRNIERTLAFYKNALGFSDANIDEGSSVGTRIPAIKRGNEPPEMT